MLDKSSACIHILTTPHHLLKFHADLWHRLEGNLPCVPSPLCISFFTRQPERFFWKLRSSGHSSGLTLRGRPIWLTVKTHVFIGLQSSIIVSCTIPSDLSFEPLSSFFLLVAAWSLCCSQPLRAQFCLGTRIHPSSGMFVFHVPLKIPSLKSSRSLYKSHLVSGACSPPPQSSPISFLAMFPHSPYHHWTCPIFTCSQAEIFVSFVHALSLSATKYLEHGRYSLNVSWTNWWLDRHMDEFKYMVIYVIKVSGKAKTDTQVTFWSKPLFLLLYHVNKSTFFPEIYGRNINSGILCRVHHNIDIYI